MGVPATRDTSDKNKTFHNEKIAETTKNRKVKLEKLLWGANSSNPGASNAPKGITSGYSFQNKTIKPNIEKEIRSKSTANRNIKN